MKRILYIHHGQGLGGAPLSLLALIKSLDRSSYHPIVLFLRNSEVIELFRQQNIDVYGPVNRYDFSHTVIWWFRWYHLPYLLKAVKDTIITAISIGPAWLDQLKPELVHLNTSSLVAWGYAAHKKKIPVVWHIREPLAQGYLGLRKKLITFCVKRWSSAIIPISANDAKPWAKNPKVTVIHNPVDHIRFNISKHPAVTPIHPTILFLGGLSREKGTDRILEVFNKLLQTVPNAHLVIAGYFDVNKQFPWYKTWFPEYRFVCRVRKLYENLSFHTTLTGPTTKVPELLSQCSVLVFPATIGHFARPVIEAGFMKKPVIASHLAPLDELVIDGKTGDLCDPDNLDAWVDQLTKILLNPDRGLAMGQTAYDFCHERFELIAYGEKISVIYAKLCHRNP